MLRRKLVVHHHELRGAGHEDRHIVLLVVVRILAGHLDQADPYQVVHHLLRLLVRHPVHLGQILDVVRHAGLFKAQEELCFFLSNNFIECPVLRIICVHGPGIFDKVSVRDHCPKL